MREDYISRDLILRFAELASDLETAEQAARRTLSDFLWAPEDIEVISVESFEKYGDKAFIVNCRIKTIGSYYQIKKDVETLLREKSIWLLDKPHIYKRKEPSRRGAVV